MLKIVLMLELSEVVTFYCVSRKTANNTSVILSPMFIEVE